VTRYSIVSDQSQVWIEARSSVHPIHTETKGLEGYIDLEMNGDGRISVDTQPSARLSLPVERLKSGNRFEDREMLKRIDAKQFSTIDGVLTLMKDTGRDSRYLVHGDVTFRGVTCSHQNEMTISAIDDRTIVLEGESTFDVRDFGMEPPKILMLRVHPEVNVRVQIFAQSQ
jgi:polyisoprenoid-binding protein YceI